MGIAPGDFVAPRGVDRFQAERTGVVVMPVSFPFRLLNV